MLNAYYILSSGLDTGDTELKDTTPAIEFSLFKENEQMNKLIITLSIAIKICIVNKLGKHLYSYSSEYFKTKTKKYFL